MSTEYRLIVSTNTQLWVALIKKDLTSLQQRLSSVPKVTIVERFTCIENTLEVSNYHVHLYVANCSIFNFLFFSFRQKRTKKICLEKGWGRTLDVQKWLQQYSSSWSEGHHRHRKEITSCQVGLWTFIHTFSGYLLNFRKRFSSGNVCWHRSGSHRMWQGFCWNFMLLGIWNW